MEEGFSDNIAAAAAVAIVVGPSSPSWEPDETPGDN
jgi:hypothetical protein